MTVSSEEALGLLSKWKSESTPVVGLVVFDGGTGTFGGFISDVNADKLVVAQTFAERPKSVEMSFAFARAIDFQYQDVREAPTEIRQSLAGIVSFLSMIIGGSRLCIYEREQ